ncbi:MAG: NUDIX hydrolase [Dehalococcoidia bacterium]|nr:NUDIX hydrolase [Dehalococcoidia bacterium]
MGTERTQQSRLIYKGRILNLREDLIELSGGRTAKREIVEHQPAVVMVALDGGDNVILVRQYRKAVEAELMEAPAGGLNDGESPEQGAQRELEEETGFRAGRLQSMGGFYSAPGFCTEYLHAFLCTDLRRVGARPEEDEEITVVPTPVARIPELIRTGQIRDAKSVAGLLMYLSLYRPR